MYFLFVEEEGRVLVETFEMAVDALMYIVKHDPCVLRFVVGQDVPSALHEAFDRECAKLQDVIEAHATRLLGAPPATLPQTDLPQMDLQRIEWATKELARIQDSLGGVGGETTDEVDCGLIAALDEVRAELSRLLP